MLHTNSKKLSSRNITFLHIVIVCKKSKRFCELPSVCILPVFQSLWRCHAADPAFKSTATWKIHFHHHHHHLHNMFRSTAGHNSTLGRMARRASLLTRRFSSQKLSVTESGIHESLGSISGNHDQRRFGK